MKEVIAYNPPVDWVKSQILNAGTTIGSVHFYKRTDNSLRKMCYKLHCKNPSAVKAPKGLTNTSRVTGVDFKRKVIDKENNQMTVLSTNDTVRDKEGKIIGRGKYKTIPLEKVIRICTNGKVITINRSY